MRKTVLLCLTLLCFFILTKVEASVIIYPRDENNLGIKEDIEVTDDNLPFILNTPKINANEKIYDFADLFSYDEERRLYIKVKEYIEKTSYDLAIVTINNNPKSYWRGQDPTTVYADDFYDYNDFKKSGVLFLIDMDRRVFYISTSSNAIIMYDDQRIGNILDSIDNEIKEGKYYSACNTLVYELEDYYDDGIPSSNKNCKIGVNGEYICYRKMPYLFIAIISGFITAIIMYIIIKSYKKINIATHAERYLVKDKRKITNRKDEFLRSNTKTVKVKSSSNGTGSFRGGSSTHRSSSGRSHGGGGRRF